MKSTHILTTEEAEILTLGATDPNITLGYLFKKKGAERGFQLDYNFVESKKWQVDFTMAYQTFVVVIGGIGTGKTLAAGLGGFYHCVQTPGFKFLNIAKESWQSQLMYELILENLTDTPAEEFVVSSPKRPYPQIVIEYMNGPKKHKATMEFMSLGEQGDATNVFSWRGDWINIEEAGRIDGLQLIVSNLSTRLTGATAEGRPFMGRMSLISNPWDNQELWQMLDLAKLDTKDGLSFELETADNMNVTERQLENSLKLIPEAERERYVTGNRPEGRGTYFPKKIVEPCEDLVMSHALEEGVKNGQRGYIANFMTRVGFYHYELPPQEGRLYFMLGDPGTDNAPKRNAPVWMMFDVTDAPKSVPIVAMWWGFGNGSISPFVAKMLEWIEYYKPIFAGLDSTSTQKNMAEVMNMEYIFNKNLSVEKLAGLDFSGGRRFSYLVCLKLAIENQNLRWPKIITGISSQLQNYDPTKDKSQAAKLPQDLVATMGMAAFAIRARYGQGSEETGDGLFVSHPQAEFNRRQAREYNPSYRNSSRRSRKTSRH